MANVRRIVIGLKHFTSSTCGFGFADSVNVPEEEIDSEHIRIRRLVALFPGTKIELGPLVKDQPHEAPAEKGRQDAPAAIAHVRVDDLGGDIWAAIPVDVNGEDRECLVADGGVMMSHGDALALATEHAASLGVEVTGVLEKPVVEPEKAPDGDPADVVEGDPEAEVVTEEKAAVDEVIADVVDSSEVAEIRAREAESVVEAKGELNNSADVDEIAKAAAEDEAAKADVDLVEEPVVEKESTEADAVTTEPAPKPDKKKRRRGRKGKKS